MTRAYRESEPRPSRRHIVSQRACSTSRERGTHLFQHPQTRQSLERPSDRAEDAEDSRNDMSRHEPRDEVDDTRSSGSRNSDEAIGAEEDVPNSEEEVDVCKIASVVDSLAQWLVP